MAGWCWLLSLLARVAGEDMMRGRTVQALRRKSVKAWGAVRVCGNEMLWSS